jgi:hypothetical protein
MGSIRKDELGPENLESPVPEGWKVHLQVGQPPEVWSEQSDERLEHGMEALILPLKVVGLQEEALVPEERFLDGHGFPLMS